MSTDQGSVGRLASRLAAQPTNLGVWWELAAALSAASRPTEAKSTYVSLGKAASAIGHPALAIACARALSAAGAADEADELARRVAREHGRGGAKIEVGMRSAPPAPPIGEISSGGARIDAPAALDEAVALAERAVRGAASSAESRAPAKLAPTPLISVLTPDEMVEMASVMELRHIDKGQVVVDVGQPATALYWIARGSVEVSKDGKFLGELVPNQFFGEIALVGGTRRTARVTAAMDCAILVIPADKVETVAQKQPGLGKILAEYARARLLATVMRTSELFSRLSSAERKSLLPLFETEIFDAGDVIVEQGSHNQRLYVVASGRCQVRDGQSVITSLDVGDGIGEMSLLARRPATFDVVALESTVVLSLSRERFDEIAVNHPGLLAEVYKLLVQRESENQALVHDASDLIV